MSENWELQLVLKMQADEEHQIANLLEEIARAIRKGKYSGQGRHCAGTYDFLLVESGIVPDNALRNWLDQVK